MSSARTEIIAGALEATAWEMCASLIRTAYSPNIKERADCSSALIDATGRILSVATHAPAHLGSTLRLVEAIRARFPWRKLRPGDVFLANDPYIVGVTHLNDCTVAAPVFVDGKLVGFTAAVAHHSDVGGRVPGSESGDSVNIFQEGIRFPPVRLFEGGVRRADVWELFLLNSRTPHFSEGDLLAQCAANNRGSERMRELYAKHGASTIAQAIDAMLDATERRASNRIREVLGEGTFSAVHWLDEDGINDEPVKLAVEISIAGGRITYDFSDCPAQLPTGKNIPLTHTLATVYYCTKAIVDPGLPVNTGLYRAVDVIAPEGSLVNPRPPAGVGSRNLTAMILADAILDALGQAAPVRAMAAGGPYQGIILSGQDARRGRYFVDYENFAGGQGGLNSADGMDSFQLHMTNTSNLPIEVMELEFPVRVECYELLPDSGGPGEYRGGLGVRRDLRILATNVQLACRSARQKFPAPGSGGGQSGSAGCFILKSETGSEARLRSTFSEYTMKDGDLLRILTPGGGGFGHPLRRSVDRVVRDVCEGKVSASVARGAYGVALRPDGTLDAAETARLRGAGEQGSGRDSGS